MKKRWRKVLYEDSGKPDNYIDDTFLDDLKKNCEWIFSPWAIKESLIMLFNESTTRLIRADFLTAF
jgi:hypothetical protein